MPQRSLYKFVLLVILSSLQPGQLQEEQPTSGGENDAGLAAAFDEIKALLTAIENKTCTHITEFRSFKDQMEVDFKSLRDDLNSLNDSVNNLSACFQEHKQQTAYKLAEVTNSKLDTLNATTARLSTDLQEIQTKITNAEQQTVGKLVELQTSLTDTNSRLATTTAQLSTGLQEIQTNISNVECLNAEEFLQLYEYLQTNLTHEPEKEEKNVTNNSERYTCGGTGGWRRIVYLDMTDPSTTCPSGWQLTGHSKRTCGRVSTQDLACDSVTFPVSGGEYSRVCGRIKAYQHGLTDAFEAYHDGDVTTIDGAYVSGVSLTHGNPRKHIWTFAAGYAEIHRSRKDVCPCDASTTIRIPPFVGDDYFCESGRNAGGIGGFYPDDPLWDGQNCASSSTCCSFNTPPYFVKQLPTPTTDDIEARLCLLDSGEDSPVELIELYVQ